MGEIRVGAARTVITPPLGTPLAGYFEPHYSEENINDLQARAIAFDDGTERVAWVVCDVLAISEASVARIRDRVERSTGLPGNHLLVSATHTHTGPQTVEVFGLPAAAEYLVTFEAAVADAVALALNNLKPSLLFVSHGVESRVSCNRRLVFRDGTVHTHTTDADWPEVVGREGPVDQELVVLTAEDGEGHAHAAAVNFALHPTNVRGDRVCTDYPGYLAAAVEAELGQGSVAVFLNGACGNIDSKTPFLEDVVYGPGRAQRIGDVLAATALGTRTERTPLNAAPVSVASGQFPLPLKEVDEDRAVLAANVMGEEEPETLRFTTGTRRPSAVKERIYAAETVRHFDRIRMQPHVVAEIQAFRVGELVVVGVPVELFCEHGLAIKAAARRNFKHVMIVELANGYHGYVPVRQSFDGGGYETRLASSSCLAPEAGEMIVDAARHLLDSLTQ